MRSLCYGLVFLFLAALPYSTGQDTFKQSDAKDCGMEGTAKSEAGKEIDRLKNRFVAPTIDQIDADLSLTAMLTPGDDIDRFDHNKGAKIAAFVVDVKVGGVETCNCRAKNPIDRDTHIVLGASVDAPKTHCVIVEVTPRIRAQKKAVGEDWSTEGLRTALKGKWVEFTGWLLFDTPHVHEAENTQPGNPKNWRATCWEIHPVTSMKNFNSTPPNAVVLSTDVLSTFHGIQKKQFERDAAKKAATHTRNRALRESFDKDDLDEELPK